MKQPNKNKRRDTFKNSGPGQREKIMKDRLYGKSSGSGTIRKDEGFNFTKYLPERLKKKVQNLRNMKKGGSLGQYD
jgi:hypothetical protein